MRIKFGDLANFRYGKMPIKNKLSNNGEYPVYSGYRIVGYYDEFNICENQLIIVVRGVGGTGDVKLTKEKCYLTNLSVSVDLKSDDVNVKYLYYYFLCNNLRYLDTGSAQSQITINDLKNVELNLPDIITQQKTAKILSSLDDKIELNNRINKNLEEQAQALFKSWFVDFEPFGGVMPSDWGKGCLLDIAEYINGLAMQKFRPAEGEKGLPVLKIKELRQGICDDNSELCSPSINDEYIVHDGDVIFSWSGSLLVDLWCGGTCGLNQHLFKVTSNKYNKWFFYLWTKYYLDRFIAIAADKATTMGHIKREDLQKAEVIIPSISDMKKLDDVLNSIIELIIVKRIENRKLANIRDTLLPKLMSGEIDVDNIQGE